MDLQVKDLKTTFPSCSCTIWEVETVLTKVWKLNFYKINITICYAHTYFKMQNYLIK